MPFFASQSLLTLMERVWYRLQGVQWTELHWSQGGLVVHHRSTRSEFNFSMCPNPALFIFPWGFLQQGLLKSLMRNTRQPPQLPLGSSQPQMGENTVREGTGSFYEQRYVCAPFSERPFIGKRNIFNFVQGLLSISHFLWVASRTFKPFYAPFLPRNPSPEPAWVHRLPVLSGLSFV